MGRVISWLWHHRNYVITLGVPVVLLPLPLVSPTSEARCGYAILLMALYWCTECLPLAVTSLLPVVLFPMMGIMQAGQVSSEYLKDTIMLFIGGLLVAIAVEQWNLHKRIALRVLLMAGMRPALLMMGFMMVSAFLSMWINNTATAAMMLPIGQAVLEQMKATHSGQIHTDTTDPGDRDHPALEMENSTTKEEMKREKHPDARQEEATNNADGDPEERQDSGRTQEEDVFARLSKGISLSVCYSASIGGTATLTGTLPNLVLKGQLDNFVSDGTVSIFLSMLFFVIPSQLPSRRGYGHDDAGVKVKAPVTLLTWQLVHERMPWNVVLLLGGGYALAAGSEVSGLSTWLGDSLSPLEKIPAFAISLLLCLLVAIFTECSSNTATTTLFLPILASMAVSIKLHPLYVMLPCTISASLAFMLPVATAPNAIAFSFGNLKVMDMVKAGFMLNIIGILTINLGINTWGYAMFDMGTFPTWANISQP
ncbi:solute carrier family 13 member 2-like isoform X2 [Festucalex cinctus]